MLTHWMVLNDFYFCQHIFIHTCIYWLFCSKCINVVYLPLLPHAFLFRRSVGNSSPFISVYNCSSAWPISVNIDLFLVDLPGLMRVKAEPLQMNEPAHCTGSVAIWRVTHQSMWLLNIKSAYKVWNVFKVGLCKYMHHICRNNSHRPSSWFGLHQLTCVNWIFCVQCCPK